MPERRPSDHPWIRRGLLWGGFAAIALLTLLPTDPAVRAPGWQAAPRTFDPGYLTDVLLNMLLFVPFGAGLQSSRFRWRWSVLIVAVFSATIELLQLDLIANRDASLHDLASNTAGGAIGWWLWSARHELAHPASRAWRRRVIAFAAIPVAGWIAGARLTPVDAPGGELRWSIGDSTPGEWVVSSVGFRGHPETRDRHGILAATGTSVLPLVLDLDIRNAAPSRGVARLLSIETPDERPVAEVWRVGDGIEVRPAVRLSHLGFGEPRLRLPGVVSAPASALAFRMRLESRWVRFTAQPTGQAGSGTAFVLSPQFLLAGAIGSGIPVNHHWPLLVGFWMFVQLAPVAVVAGGAARPRSAIAALLAVAALGAGLILANGVMRLPAEPPAVWLGVAGAVGLGLVWKIRTTGALGWRRAAPPPVAG